MKQYYCLLLNNCYDKGVHWVCPNVFSMVPNVLEKDIEDLSLLENEFMDLDDTITVGEESYHVLGSFPVFGEIKDDGKMYDVITGRCIVEALTVKEASDLSYIAKYSADSKMVEEMLTLIDAKSKKRYEKYLEDLSQYSKKVFYGAAKPDKYLMLKLENASLNTHPLITKLLNGQVIDAVTKERIYPITLPNTVTSHLSTKLLKEMTNEEATYCQIALIDAGIEKYIKSISSAKANAVKGYNTFVALNRDKVKSRKKQK